MNDLYKEIVLTIHKLQDNATLPEFTEDLIAPITDIIVEDNTGQLTTAQILEVLKHQREVIQSIADRLGRLAVAISVGPQAVTDFKESLDNE